MDSSLSRLLSDKLYDKRKAGALELENQIRTALAEGNHEKIHKIVNQLVHNYAYAVHQPHARNGGLIGLAAAAIALASEVPPYLPTIIPPVLACFGDQDARVRYYACESMYNIAKVAKGEILIYFNDVFDALCKLAADTELSVKNGAELLDRLVKDIVSESAVGYASILVPEPRKDGEVEGEEQQTTAFSLPKFIPLLQERIHVLNPFTRTFLVSWITLLDSIPDLELVAYLPSFLGGLLKFLSDPNQDVHTTTKVALDRFLTEIKKIAAVKKGLAESRRSREEVRKASGDSNSAAAVESLGSQRSSGEEKRDGTQTATTAADEANGDDENGEPSSTTAVEDDDNDDEDEKDGEALAEEAIEDEWIPGQDVQIDYQQILDILVTFLSSASESGAEEEVVQLTILKWIESFFDICPEDILVFTPRLLAQVLPALSDDVDKVKQAAGRVNQALRAYVMSLPEEPKITGGGGVVEQQPHVAAAVPAGAGASAPAIPGVRALTQANGVEKQQSTLSLPQQQQQRQPQQPALRTTDAHESPSHTRSSSLRSPEPPNTAASDFAHRDSSQPPPSSPSHQDQHQDQKTTTDLDYEAAVNALTLQFLHSHEATRVAALQWLLMLHRKSPRRILAIQDATFPALLKTLSDPAEEVVRRDLLLLSQISKSSGEKGDDRYFEGFIRSLLRLFGSDRRLLEMRGNLIVRQLCLTLGAEKIYRVLADALERETSTTSPPTSARNDNDIEARGGSDDIDFPSIMVQNLNNNLLTAPELSPLRTRLRALDSREAQQLFTTLFRAWCVNAVATFSLCLLAQAYEPAYHLLQLFAEMEMSVTMLIQIDKLVQLLESPVFTYLRMQLLEPERFPFLYKCLYGLLMLLPQSSAFAALKNRLGSVSAIGYLHIPRGAGGPGGSGAGTQAAGVGGVGAAGAVGAFERQNRLKSRDEGGIRWGELLEKFRSTQEKVRRNQLRQLGGGLDDDAGGDDTADEDGRARLGPGPDYSLKPLPTATPQSAPARPESAQSLGRPGSAAGVGRVEIDKTTGMEKGQQVKHKTGLSQLRGLASGRKKEKEREKK